MNQVNSGEAALSTSERVAINTGRWFSLLEPCVRHDLLRYAKVRRYESGEMISAAGAQAAYWYAVASGSVHIRSLAVTGKPTALTFVGPGVWFGDPGLFDGGTSTHDAYAHGPTTILAVPLEDLERMLAESTNLCNAIMRFQARHIRDLYSMLHESDAPLGARLARQLMQLARQHGEQNDPDDGSIRIRLKLVQEDIAQLVGASRQRVNVELKLLERAGTIKIERSGLVVCDQKALSNIHGNHH